MLSRGIARCLTGDPKDLRRLLSLYKLTGENPTVSAFLKKLSLEMAGRTGAANLLLHVGKHANRTQKRRLIENLALNWMVKGRAKRLALRTQDRWVPFFVVISPTMRCNLACTGCYSALYSKDGELAEQEMDRILTECKSIGCHFVVLSGGEPYLIKNALLRLFRKHSDIFFLTFTNATLLDEALIRALAKLGNVAPAISVEGYSEHTDRRRSRGVYENAMCVMDLLKKYGVVYGISVTYTRENVNLVTDDRFVEFYVGKGAMFGWYFMFMPVGKDPVLELVPTPEQRFRCGQRVVELRNRYPIFLADFWNDGAAAGGCLAGGRKYLHILNSGRVEPCVYAHFGVDNIREKSLLEAANSPFFKAIRSEFPFSENGNLKRPCMIIDNPQVLRKLVNEYVVPQGHAHAEDILCDPKVMQWIDDYAARFRELTDPVWEKLIENPEYRWHKEKKEYKLLFRFKPGGKQPANHGRD